MVTAGPSFLAVVGLNSVKLLLSEKVIGHQPPVSQRRAMGKQTPSRHPALLIKRISASETNREAVTFRFFHFRDYVTSEQDSGK